MAMVTHTARARRSQRPLKEVTDGETLLLIPLTPRCCSFAPSVTTPLYSTTVSKALRTALRGSAVADFREPDTGEVRRTPLLGNSVNKGAATLYLLHLVLLGVSGLTQAVVQVSHPIPLNDLLRVL